MPASESQRLFAAGAAGLCWFALVLQLYLSIGRSIDNGAGVAHGIWMYVAFFTVLTNLVVAVVLTAPLLAPQSGLGRFCARPATIAGTAVNIALVGITYNLLLRHTWNPQGLQLLGDILLHDAVPIVFVVYAWWYAGPARAALVDRASWALWPLAYFIYAIVRGAASGFYPYPFIDVGRLGYGQVLVNAVGVCFGYFLVAAALFTLDRLRPRRLAT
ncbi:MAG TPA: Pr6Pr family membrane protein [Rudaea sp.]|jgi:hypothetical protein